jgi:hypothetical protein
MNYCAPASPYRNFGRVISLWRVSYSIKELLDVFHILLPHFSVTYCSMVVCFKRNSCSLLRTINEIDLYAFMWLIYGKRILHIGLHDFRFVISLSLQFIVPLLPRCSSAFVTFVLLLSRGKLVWNVETYYFVFIKVYGVMAIQLCDFS